MELLYRLWLVFKASLYLLLVLTRLFCVPDDEARVGQLRALRLGQERAEAGQQARSLGEHLRLGIARSNHHGRARHALHHGTHGRVPAGPRLDRRQLQSRTTGELLL